MSKKDILIIDDEQEMLNSLEKILSRRKDFKLTLCDDPQQALQWIKNNFYDLILTDLKMQKYSGMDILQAALAANPSAKVILISGYGTIETSVGAIHKGAFDFLEKPFTAQKLYKSIERALAESEIVPPHSEASDVKIFEGILYKGPQMAGLLNMVQKISKNKISVLISGESGTGKELIARAIHNLSDRKLNPFVPVNCGALPENLFESEIFGFERGAFTGANHTKPGLLEFANQGTFFLDEIGDLSLSLQVKLLRMLEEKKIRHVGGNKEIEIDVRIIAATNKSLETLVEKGLFREDLYYRLTTMKIDIPPLRERKEDIIPLARYFLQQVCMETGERSCSFSSLAEEQLQMYDWPGNVRELQNAVNRAFYLRSAENIQESDLPLPVKKQNCLVSEQLLDLPYKSAREKVLSDFEAAYLTHLLKKNHGNISKAAEYGGLDRRSIHRLINKHNIIFKNT